MDYSTNRRIYLPLPSSVFGVTLQPLLGVPWVRRDTVVVHVLQYLTGNFVQHFAPQGIDTLP
jgi:hypothetical protein